MGIEPTPLAWKARALPLCNTRFLVDNFLNIFYHKKQSKQIIIALIVSTKGFLRTSFPFARKKPSLFPASFFGLNKEVLAFLTQLVEYFHGKEKVIGSNPIRG